MIRVRFAPSPTGFVHLGSLRTALYNFLFARNHDGKFILRIEDTDRSRYVEGATENLLSVLEWAGLVADEGPERGGDYGPYFQSQRTELYIKYANQLVQNDHAYYAFDTPEDIDRKRETVKASGRSVFKYDASTRREMVNSLTLPEGKVQDLLLSGTPHVIRLKIPENQSFEFDDVVRGNVTFASEQVDDTVLVKSDGFPTYHLANVVDDHLMEITHVIRGEEWLSSVPKHVFLYQCFGWSVPVMAHLPLIFNPDGSKMSKRSIQSLSDLPGKVDPDVQTYIKAGYEKQALLNYIALLGWNPGDDREVFTPEELISNFTLERVNKSAAIFDLNKLNHINFQHLSRMNVDELTREFKSRLEAEGIDIDSETYLAKVVALLQSRLHFRHEFVDYSRYFFKNPQSFDPKVVKKRWKSDSGKLILEFINEISKLSSFDKHALEDVVHRIAERNEVGNGRIIHPVRLAVSGVGVGPGLFDMLEVLGEERVIRRLKKAVEILEPQH